MERWTTFCRPRWGAQAGASSRSHCPGLWKTLHMHWSASRQCFNARCVCVRARACACVWVQLLSSSIGGISWWCNVWTLWPCSCDTEHVRVPIFFVSFVSLRHTFFFVSTAAAVRDVGSHLVSAFSGVAFGGNDCSLPCVSFRARNRCRRSACGKFTHYTYFH